MVASEVVDDRAGTAPVTHRSRRRRVRTVLVVVHRWLSLTLGLLLVVITTTGALLVYRPEIQRALDPVYDRASAPATITVADALVVVRQERPDFGGRTAIAEHGIYRVVDADYERYVAVDPGTGRIIGSGSTNDPVFGVLDQIHECLFTCERYPAHLAWTATTLPALGGLTVGALVLGVTGLLLLVLAVTGLWVWWPRAGRWKAATRVRLRKGRYARDYDLHQVTGLVVTPLLLLWGVTGAGFEFPFVADAWYALTPGAAPPADDAEFTSHRAAGPDLTPAAALAAAIRVAGSDRVVSITAPATDDPTGAYSFWFADGLDPYVHTSYPGDLEVRVDRHDAAHAEISSGGPGTALATDLWQTWNYPTHAGYVVNGWWRSVWFVAGLVPLLLMVTGLSTWSFKRGTRRRRAAAAARSAQAAGQSPAPSGA